MSTKWLDFKIRCEPMIVTQRAVVQVRSEMIVSMLSSSCKEFIYKFFRELDRQDAVLETIVVEDVGKGRRDDYAKAVVFQSPGSVLAARAAAEVSPRQERTRPLRVRMVQFELRVMRTIVQLGPIPEQELSKTSAFDPLQELLGNDLIGIDIRPIHGNDFAGVFGK